MNRDTATSVESSLDLVRAQVGHALGIAVADAAAHLRNMYSLSETATAVSLRLVLDKSLPNAEAEAALGGVNTALAIAAANLENIAKAAQGVLTKSEQR